jgi:hypothetical protein
MQYASAITSIPRTGNTRSSLFEYIQLLVRNDFEQTRKSKGMLRKLLQEEDVQKWAFGTTITAMKAEIRDIETKSQEVYIKGMKTELENLRDRTLYFGSYWQMMYTR